MALFTLAAKLRAVYTYSSSYSSSFMCTFYRVSMIHVNCIHDECSTTDVLLKTASMSCLGRQTGRYL